MALNLSADEVLTTTRSVRKRLDFDRPVDRATVEECLDIALQAPTGSNRQGWHWVVVEDAAKKQAISEIYAENFAIYAAAPAGTDFASDDPRTEHREAVRSSAQYLADNFHRVPLMLIPCIEGTRQDLPPSASAGLWGSLLPAVWSFMLALREREMGSAWTTLHLIRGGEEKVAELLGIPYDTILQGGLFPIAYTIGTDFKPATRLGVDQVLHWDTW